MLNDWSGSQFVVANQKSFIWGGTVTCFGVHVCIVYVKCEVEYDKVKN